MPGCQDAKMPGCREGDYDGIQETDAVVSSGKERDANSAIVGAMHYSWSNNWCNSWSIIRGCSYISGSILGPI